MPPSGFRWAVQYWHGPSPQGPLPTFTSRDGPWANAPAHNVIRVLLQRHGIRPHGNPDVLYTQTKEGPDHYYLIVASDAVRLGGWNDDGRPSHEVTWRADGRIFNVRRHAPPALDPAQLKHGVWVDEPWATRLGLSGGISRQEWQSASAREGALRTMGKLFLRDTSVESCADGSSGFDMDPTQGSPTADVSASVNSATFTEVLTWDETVGTNGKSGDYDLSVDVSTLSTDAEFRFRLQRLNAACAVQESSAYGPTFNTVGIKAATITFSPAWAANDVLRLSLERRRSGGHGSRSISVSTQDPDSFTDEPADPNVTILAVAAQATADVLAPAIKAGATVAAALAAAAAQALLPTIKIAKTVAPPAASATAHAPSPTIAAIQNVTVAAQPAQAAADTLLPTIAAGIAIVAALAQAAAGAPPPAVLAQSGGIVILAALATATATGHEPAIGGYLDLTATLTLVASLSAALTATATASPSATLAAADAPSATIERI